MSELPQRNNNSTLKADSSSNSGDTDTEPVNSDQNTSHNKLPTTSYLSNFFTTTFSIFDITNSSSACEKEVKNGNYGWRESVRKAMSGGAIRRLQERILGASRTDVSSSTSEIWLLGECYKVSPEESSSTEDQENGLLAFQQDFSSRIWVTYRKGFDAIGDSKYTSDVNWGCMIRSSQMLIAQALLFHYLGRSWRRPTEKLYDPKYIELLHLFGDSEESAFSIHNLLLAGKGYGLAAGSWVGPYAMCRSWEVLNRTNLENADMKQSKRSLPMAVYIVSGDEDGERGGAPVVHIDVALRLSSEFKNGEATWAPILLLVPLVLGLDKVNPRYNPLLWETFTFPQSLGILGGKPGASTYIVGVQDDMALYLDPHEVQPAVNISHDNLEADTSSYHCSTMRHMPLEQIDPSLAFGFYCRDKDDFDDFCAHATDLAERSNGAPLFTVDQSLQPSNRSHRTANNGTEDIYHVEHMSDFDTNQNEEDWQLL